MSTDLRKMERREADDSYRHVLKYTSIFGGVQGLKMLVTLLRNKLTSHLLGKAGMGINAIFLNISEIINSWTNFGIPFYAVRRLSELYEEGSDDDLRRFVGVIRTWSVWSALLGGMLCFVFASWLNSHYFPSGENHTLEILFLSIFVASIPIEAVECSILKGMRRLRTVAYIEILCALSTFVLTIPIYYFLGFRGIILSIILCGWAMALIHLYFSTRIYRYSISLFSIDVIREGWPLIRIGIPYVLAGAVTAMATGEVLSYLNDAEQVGLYKAGFGLLLICSSVVMMALDTDYFPRLSSVNHDMQRLNHAINQQVDVGVLLMAPILIMFILTMPLLIRILLTAEFLPIAPMVYCAVFYAFLHIIIVPIGYTSAARGDLWLYFIVEAVYDIAFVLAVRYGYSQMGLIGAGIALSVVALFDLILVGCVFGLYYKISLRRKTVGIILLQATLLFMTVAACLWLVPAWRLPLGAVLFALSLMFSWHRLSPEIPVLARIRNMFLRSKD